MKIYQPMLFVGLGGTGCQIGAELERRLREELCGPDGTDLQRKLLGSSMLPFQLPPFLQFVYADLNEAELLRAKKRVVPTEEYLRAATRTDHFVQKLVPRYRTYPEVARSLRANAYEETQAWLPPQDGEPKVSPLVLGAGQLPTVGRAALFETFRSGLDGVLQPLGEAIGRITKSGGELAELGGKLEQSCDVFVAFSVAGGTGAGIFYDFLHLIGDTFRRESFRAQIYPLVLMPSAFEEGHGGGRRAKLNAGRALLDLFRLIDDQNARGAETRLPGRRPSLVTAGPSKKISVTYPEFGEIELPPTTVQTGFLFSRTAAVDRDDLHRSVVSFVLSLVGTSLAAEQENAPIDRTYQSFAEQFINQGVDRQVTAYTGIGNRGVSTSLVASMTVPVDDLADIISSRLLARAVDEMSVPPPGGAEDNQRLVERFYASCGLEELRTCEPEPFKEPSAPPRGSAAINQALRTRITTMNSKISTLEGRLRTLIPQLARNFDHRRGIVQGLSGTDIFRLRRVVAGHQQLSGQADQLGFIGSLESHREAPPAPPGISVTPPAVEPARTRLARLRQTQWADPEIRRAIARQDRWYHWRAQAAWHAAWGEQAPLWDRKVTQLRAELSGLCDAFLAHARGEPLSFALRTGDLYKARTGVSYLLPPQGDLEQFYQAAVRRFVARPDLGLRSTSTEAEIVTALLGSDGWRHSYELVIERGPDHGVEDAVLFVRNLLKQAVKRLFVAQGNYGENQPLLPALPDLLARAAGKDGPSIADEDLAAFRRGIAGLVPAGFTPQGSGDLKILVSYPQAAPDAQIEAYIEEQVNLPKEPTAPIQYRATDNESIVVVLLRTSMSVTEVPELREILRHWSEALRAEQQQDFLAWRQRLSFDFRWLATTEQDRIAIMHRLLCAMWNEQIDFIGKRDSPQGVVVSLQGERPLSMELPLTPFGRASSWVSLLRAYEEWTFEDGDQIRQDFCQKLMTTLPRGLNGDYREPSDLYVWFVDELRLSQVELLRSMAQAAPSSVRGWIRQLHDFWANTVPQAVNMKFQSTQNTYRGSLQELRDGDIFGDDAAVDDDFARGHGERWTGR
jgi:Tubulin like